MTLNIQATPRPIGPVQPPGHVSAGRNPWSIEEDRDLLVQWFVVKFGDEKSKNPFIDFRLGDRTSAAMSVHFIKLREQIGQFGLEYLKLTYRDLGCGLFTSQEQFDAIVKFSERSIGIDYEGLERIKKLRTPQKPMNNGSHQQNSPSRNSDAPWSHEEDRQLLIKYIKSQFHAHPPAMNDIACDGVDYLPGRSPLECLSRLTKLRNQLSNLGFSNFNIGYKDIPPLKSQNDFEEIVKMNGKEIVVDFKRFTRIYGNRPLNPVPAPIAAVQPTAEPAVIDSPHVELTAPPREIAAPVPLKPSSSNESLTSAVLSSRRESLPYQRSESRASTSRESISSIHSRRVFDAVDQARVVGALLKLLLNDRELDTDDNRLYKQVGSQLGIDYQMIKRKFRDIMLPKLEEEGLSAFNLSPFDIGSFRDEKHFADTVRFDSLADAITISENWWKELENSQLSDMEVGYSSEDEGPLINMVQTDLNQKKDGTPKLANIAAPKPPSPTAPTDPSKYQPKPHLLQHQLNSNSKEKASNERLRIDQDRVKVGIPKSPSRSLVSGNDSSASDASNGKKRKSSTWAVQNSVYSSMALQHGIDDLQPLGRIAGNSKPTAKAVEPPRRFEKSVQPVNDDVAMDVDIPSSTMEKSIMLPPSNAPLKVSAVNMVKTAEQKKELNDILSSPQKRVVASPVPVDANDSVSGVMLNVESPSRPVKESLTTVSNSSANPIIIGDDDAELPSVPEINSSPNKDTDSGNAKDSKSNQESVSAAKFKMPVLDKLKSFVPMQKSTPSPAIVVPKLSPTTPAIVRNIVETPAVNPKSSSAVNLSAPAPAKEKPVSVKPKELASQTSMDTSENSSLKTVPQLPVSTRAETPAAEAAPAKIAPVQALPQKSTPVASKPATTSSADSSRSFPMSSGIIAVPSSAQRLPAIVSKQNDSGKNSISRHSSTAAPPAPSMPKPTALPVRNGNEQVKSHLSTKRPQEEVASGWIASEKQKIERLFAMAKDQADPAIRHLQSALEMKNSKVVKVSPGSVSNQNTGPTAHTNHRTSNDRQTISSAALQAQIQGQNNRRVRPPVTSNGPVGIAHHQPLPQHFASGQPPSQQISRLLKGPTSLPAPQTRVQNATNQIAVPSSSAVSHAANTQKTANSVETISPTDKPFVVIDNFKTDDAPFILTADMLKFAVGVEELVKVSGKPRSYVYKTLFMTGFNWVIARKILEETKAGISTAKALSSQRKHIFNARDDALLLDFSNLMRKMEEPDSKPFMPHSFAASTYVPKDEFDAQYSTVEEMMLVRGPDFVKTRYQWLKTMIPQLSPELRALMED